MKFNNGMFGACLVVTTLLITVLAGYTLSIDREDVAVKNYNYITDVSGLFTYTDAPEYVEYNPSTNYTGYTKDSGVGGTVAFTQSATINQYRYIQDPGSTRTVNATLSYSDTFNTHIDGETTTYGPSYRIGKWTGSTYNFGTAGTVSIPPTTYNNSNWVSDDINNNVQKSNIITLTTLVNKWVSDNNLDNYASLDVSLSYGDAPVLFYSGNWESSLIYVGVPATQVNVKYATLNENNSLPTKLTVNLVSMTATGTRDDTELFNNSTDNIAVIYDYEWNNTGTMGQANASVTATITATTAPTYGYMDPTKGVTESTQGGVLHWSNGYQNDSITIKVVGSPYKRIIFSANTTGANNQIAQYGAIALYWDSDGVAYVWYKDGPESSDSNIRVPLGAWPAVQATINGTTGNVIFTPTTDINLMSVVEITGNSLIVESQFNAEEITTLTFESGGAFKPYWQITSTTVFLNTYNAVMYDPIINVGDYFDYDDWRLNFYSFATYGDTVTINNQTMIVDRSNATLTFTDGVGVERTAKLNNLYVTNETVDGETHTILTFVNVGTYDLGPTVDSTISFGGLWYFTSAIYEGVDSVQTVYNWDLDGGFHADAGQCLVIFLGVIGAGVVIARGFAGVKIQVLDWVIIALVTFGAVVYFGGLI